jgi:hypothetical protein
VLDKELSDFYITFEILNNISEVFVTDKKRRDYKLLIKLKAKSFIKASRKLFEESRKKELKSLFT